MSSPSLTRTQKRAVAQHDLADDMIDPMGIFVCVGNRRLELDVWTSLDAMLLSQFQRSPVSRNALRIELWITLERFTLQRFQYHSLI